MVIQSVLHRLALLLSLFPLSTIANNPTLSLSDARWQIQNASLTGTHHQNIITTTFDDSNWVPASVPGTVLGAYVEAGLLHDPLYGDNMHQISDPLFSGKERTLSLRIAAEQLTDCAVELHLRGWNTIPLKHTL